jgi:hypothetical protein
MLPDVAETSQIPRQDVVFPFRTLDSGIRHAPVRAGEQRKQQHGAESCHGGSVGHPLDAVGSVHSASVSVFPKIDVAHRTERDNRRHQARCCPKSVRCHGLEYANRASSEAAKNRIADYARSADGAFGWLDFAGNVLSLCFCIHKYVSAFWAEHCESVAAGRGSPRATRSPVP